MEVRSGPETKLRSFQLVQLVLASMRLVKYCKNTRKRVENTVRSQSAFLLCGDFTYPVWHQEKMPTTMHISFQICIGCLGSDLSRKPPAGRGQI